MSELTIGRGLNQQLDLSRACDTRWGSHYKSFNNFIIMFGSILDVLESLALDTRNMDEKAKTMGHLKACQTYKAAFMLHLMRDVLVVTNELNKCLKKEQDIANAMLLVEVAKRSFDIKKVLRMKEIYPDDFDEFNMSALENQLASYIVGVRDVDERFSNLNGLCDLSKRLIQTKKHSNYPLVFRLVKLALILLVVTASVEGLFRQ
ncbi:uncharacterized protein LOC129869887 [Solanum dulcamara]|uniref:uncharacterized protein LOC129869887 n=1 Tax=Solanum dulcamara TaxID=45834 RepID=UPI00248638B4|nr:uncharacterized protein LOC129869887 [Solanum dulcamara]